jgi:hypothetical protein
MIYTLQDFLLHTKSITYILMGLILVGMVGVWSFLLSRDDEDADRFNISHGKGH